MVQKLYLGIDIGTYEIKGQIRASVLGETTVDNKKKFIQINKSSRRIRRYQWEWY